jgi:hypothetical protein
LSEVAYYRVEIESINPRGCLGECALYSKRFSFKKVAQLLGQPFLDNLNAALVELDKKAASSAFMRSILAFARCRNN